MSLPPPARHVVDWMEELFPDEPDVAGALRASIAERSDRIDRAYEVVLGRRPRSTEVETARRFLTSQADLLRNQGGAGPRLPGVEPAEAAAWVDFALAMLNRNEFLYVP